MLLLKKSNHSSSMYSIVSDEHSLSWGKICMVPKYLLAGYVSKQEDSGLMLGDVVGNLGFTVAEKSVLLLTIFYP